MKNYALFSKISVQISDFLAHLFVQTPMLSSIYVALCGLFEWLYIPLSPPLFYPLDVVVALIYLFVLTFRFLQSNYTVFILIIKHMPMHGAYIFLLY